VGWGFSKKISDALAKSEAVSSGLLQDLEDAALLIPGIDADIISDITTNVIREPLIRFTQSVCEKYGIPMDDEVVSGPLWDPTTGDWISRFEHLPVTDHGRLLLVPKVIVRTHLIYRSQEYFNNYVLEFLRTQEIDAGTNLVRLLKDGSPRVTNKDLRAKYGSGKRAALRETLKHPEILSTYRKHKNSSPPNPLDHDEFSRSIQAPKVDWDTLLMSVLSVPKGPAAATRYHRAVEELLTAVFYPALGNARIEKEIHEGRKRIDIAYDNLARSGFFWWLSQHYRAPQLLVECKNYRGDPDNPALDQLTGRFSRRRGQVGILVCRTMKDKELFIARCRDTAMDDRGLVVPLDDKDLREVVGDRRSGTIDFAFMRARFDRLIN
jgi:hypothetical protein